MLDRADFEQDRETLRWLFIQWMPPPYLRTANELSGVPSPDCRQTISSMIS